MYKKKYMIGVYNMKSDNDSLIVLLDNEHEFADFFKITLNNARVILHKLYHKEVNFIRYNGKCCEVAFINVDED